MQVLNLRHRALALTVLLLCFSALVFGQGYQGGLRGRVMDAQGAVIANAKVEITDEATNVKRDTVSNAEGEFVFSAVNPATYTLSAENAGFKKFERKVIIGTQEFITLDVKLEVGAITESVLVSEEVPLMETSNASQGTLLDRQKLIDLPNVGRNPFIMAWVAPGVTPAGDPKFVRFQDQSGSSYVSFAGGPLRGNVYLVDGVPITDGINRAVIIPSLEAVEEMKIQTNTYDAELGRYAGGVYNTFLRSGSNTIHGSLFGNIRGTWGFANDFFANRAGQEKAPSPYKNFGWSIGGPVVVPKIYNGRNKTFFWLVFEGYRQNTGQFTQLNTPTALERAGDFSQSHNSDGSLKVIYDPNTTVRNPDGSYSRTPFAGNFIPVGRINPIGANIAAFFKAPTTAPSFFGQPDYAAQALLHDGFANEATGKVDHQITNWWRANFAYMHYGSREVGPDWWGTAANVGGAGWQLLRYADSTTTNQTFTPNATTVVSLRYGYNRFPNFSTFVGQDFDPKTLGFPASFVNATQGSGFPVIQMQDFVSLGSLGYNYSVPNSKSFFSSVSKFVGKHNLKAGFQFRQINWTSNSQNGVGSFAFNRSFTNRNPITNDSTSGADLASLLLGIPASGQAVRQVGFEGTFKYYGYYFHDDFRITPNLTINVGLRYEYEQGYRDRNNRLVVGFARDQVNPIAAQMPPGSGVLPKGGLLYAGVDGNPTQLGNPSYQRFAPRVGAAWKINEKTTIRGGYGTFWAPPVYGVIGAPGFAATTDYIGSTDGGLTPARSLSDPYPNGLNNPIGNIQRLYTGVGNSVSFSNEALRHGGYVHQYSVDIQRQLPGGFNFSVAFVGSLSRHLQQNAAGLNINQLDPAYFSQGNALLDQVPNPFFGITIPYANGSPGFFSSSTVSRAQLLYPYPEFGSVGMGNNNQAHARYQSYIFRVEKRFSGGLSLLAHLTASKTLDMAFAGTNFSNAAGFVVQNNYDYEAEYSLAAQNNPRRFVSVITYELPFGKGKKFANSNTLADYVIGGWQINLITTIQAGFPLSVNQNNNNAFAGTGGQRPNTTGTSPSKDGSPEDKIDQYLNPAAFVEAPAFTFGALSRTLPDRAPSANNWDISIFKSVRIKERVTAQFRAESVNVTNHPRFNPPNGLTVGSGSFGYINQQANFPRFVQLGARIQW
ncbi:MAG: TonB-dependent receptor [Candidatus Solibacter usitatus]|nr:TonB-dependent receptor [Candidatus Solibacter usitatus]